jgi:hypothetical protein
MRGLVLALPLLLAAPALGQPVLAPHPELSALADQVSAARERETDTRLVAFGTRHIRFRT